MILSVVVVIFSCPLQVQCTPAPALKTNVELVNFCYQALSEGWGYMWGTQGETCTESLIENQAKQYPEKYTRTYREISKKWIGKRVVDCSGLIHAFLKGERTGSTGLYSNSLNKGEISTLPEKPGVLLFRGTPTKMEHVGVYVGNGQVIHSSSVNKGVVQEVVSNSWTHWGECNGITYTDDTSGIIAQYTTYIPQANLLNDIINGTHSDSEYTTTFDEWLDAQKDADSEKEMVIDLGFEAMILPQIIRISKTISKASVGVLMALWLGHISKAKKQAEALSLKVHAVYFFAIIIMITVNQYIWNIF